MAAVIEVEGLMKEYGPIKAVNGIDFRVEEGHLFAFLGPNGAGKSTTINVLCTLLGKTAGRIRVAGHEVGREDARVRREIGVVFQENVLDNKLTVKENLMTRGRFYGLTDKEVKRNLDEAVSALSIAEILSRPYGRLSGGQRRRADIARALMHTPRILFLDEPTTGLDPQTRTRVWEAVRRMQVERCLTAFLTTHYMEEAAGADDVAIIDKGRIAARGTPNELRDRYSADSLRLYAANQTAVLERLVQMGLQPERRGDMIQVPVKDSLKALAVLKAVEDSIESFEVWKGSMDDVFINVTGRAIREGDEG